MSEKIQKYLANIGVDSRRQIEALIKDGRITVNGAPAHVGQRIEGNESIMLDGKPVAAPNTDETQLLIYHKPEGLICTRSDESGRPTVFEDLPPCNVGRWVMVGRLDINTTGVLLFTNNGEFANRLMHPSQGLEREYAVRVYGRVNDSMLIQLTKGVMLEDGMAHFQTITDEGGDGANHWYRVVLLRGRNREVKRLWESQGVEVSRLIRIRYGSIELSNKIPPGKFRIATQQELKTLESLLK